MKQIETIEPNTSTELNRNNSDCRDVHASHESDAEFPEAVSGEHEQEVVPEKSLSMNKSETNKGKKVAIIAMVAVGVIIGALAVGANKIWKKPDVISSSEGAIPSEQGAVTKKTIPIVLTPAKEMTFEKRISVSGSVRAKRYAMVSARIPGTLDKILVDEGDRVQAGKTSLFQTDALKLAKAVAIAKQELAVADASVREKEAQLHKSHTALEQANNDLRRYEALLKKEAVAVQVAEQQATHCKQCMADVEHTQALIALAEAEREQARLNLAIAEKDLADSLVVAPIDGRVSERLREPGEMAAAGTPVLRIEDPSLLEISVFLPEEFYAQIVPGKTKMRVQVSGMDLGEHAVYYKSPTVHQKLRTFEVKSLVEAPPEGVVPGCLAEVTIVTDAQSGVGVPAGAVQTRGGQPVVFTVVDDHAKMIPVRTGRDLEGWREVVQGVSAGTPIISMGQFLVEEGTPVSMVQEHN